MEFIKLGYPFNVQCLIAPLCSYMNWHSKEPECSFQTQVADWLFLGCILFGYLHILIIRSITASVYSYGGCKYDDDYNLYATVITYDFLLWIFTRESHQCPSCVSVSSHNRSFPGFPPLYSSCSDQREPAFKQKQILKSFYLILKRKDTVHFKARIFTIYILQAERKIR